MTQPVEMPRPYIVIGGFGRSGSNLLLKMFDVHENTYCRNEPNELHDCAFFELAPFFSDEICLDFHARWPLAVEQTACSVGAQDYLPATEKIFLKKGPLADAIAWAQSKRRLRRLVHMPDEWRCPEAVYDRRLLTKSLPVFKMLLAGAGLVEAHRSFESQKTVHIIRNPEDFLNSWYNRYVLKQVEGPEKVWANSLQSLPRILQHFGEDPARFASYSLAGLIESELWRWRFTNEQLLGLSDSSRYLLISYRQAKGDPVNTARSLFDLAGLNFETRHEDRLGNLQNKAFAKPHRTRLPEGEVKDAIARALEGSPLKAHI